MFSGNIGKNYMNMEKICLFVCIFLVHHAAAYYKLSEEEFAMIPPLHHVDRFSHCVGAPGGVYCTAHSDIVSERPNAIYDLMTNYASSAVRHYNYTQIIYGICISNRCKKYHKGNSNAELLVTYEACLNETLTRSHDLQVRVQAINCYKYKTPKIEVDSVDRVATYIFLGIMVLCALGTFYDIAYGKKEEQGVLLSFSLRANWERLCAPPTTHPEKAKLIGMNGIRFLTTILVMMGHAPIPPFLSIENPQWLEDAFENVVLQMMFQGHLITQTFFILSGFLLTYNVQAISETKKLHWTMVPKGIFFRFLRLTPVNLVVLLFTATWMKFSKLGPFWQENIGVEVEDCRQHWLSNTLYYNNYIDNSTCNLQNWSMACDMQLHIIGLFVVILSPTKKFRNRVLMAMFLIGMALPAIETYARDLDATFLVVANTLRSYFLKDPTFNNTYKRTHTNIPSFVIGMTFGYLVHGWHANPVSEKIRKISGYFYWSLFLVMISLGAATFMLFLGDGPRLPLYWRVLFSIVQKPLYGFCVALILSGLIIGVEETRFYSRILEWPLWTPLSKLTYSMFAVHVIIVRYLGGTRTTLSYVSLYHIMQEYSGLVVMSTASGFLLYMFVEAPCIQLTKVLFLNSPIRKVQEKEKVDINDNGITTNGNNGYAIHANGKPVYANGNTMYTNGNSVHANGKHVDNNGNTTNGKVNGVYTNGKPLKSE